MRDGYYAISGKIGAGKTTIANGLEAQYGYHRRGFADAIKDATAQALGCPLTHVYEQKQIFRSSLQALGQAGRAYWGEDYWVEKLLTYIEGIESEWPHPRGEGLRFVLDDLRFPNEAKALKEFGFKLVRIEEHLSCHQVWCDARGYTEEQQSHISETALDSWKEWDIVLRGRPEYMCDVFASFLVSSGLAADFGAAYQWADEYLGVT